MMWKAMAVGIRRNFFRGPASFLAGDNLGGRMPLHAGMVFAPVVSTQE